jgi:hypothetical protein
MKPRLYIAFGYHLSCIADEHRSANGSCQVSVAALVPTKKRFAELLCEMGRGNVTPRDVNSTLRTLNTYCLVQVAHEHMAVYPTVTAAVVKVNTLYYSPDGHCMEGYVKEWFEVTSRS